MGKIILIIEDDIGYQNLTAKRLRRAGYEVVITDNGRAAADWLRTQQPDLILCDINMPEMDGYQILRHIRANAELAEVPVIMLTSQSESEDRAKAYRLGANGYILKKDAAASLLPAVQKSLV